MEAQQLAHLEIIELELGLIVVLLMLIFVFGAGKQ